MNFKSDNLKKIPEMAGEKKFFSTASLDKT